MTGAVALDFPSTQEQFSGESGAAARTDSPWPGRPPEIAGYTILRELGRGNMGVVYQARQAGIERVVALKVVLAGIHARLSDLHRFLAEACVVGRLQHPNIVQVHEVGQCDGVPFFSMEYVSGGTLAHRLAARPRPFREAASLVLTLARAVQCAHEHGVVHRDLKPANILLAPMDSRCGASGIDAAQGVWVDGDQAWMPKVADFGLAKQLDEPSGHTQSDMVLGTPSYMAPEQADGRSRHVGPAADVYALGVILYECLTGRPPYNAASPAETVLLLFNSEPPPPSRLHPRLPRDLETICLKCLQKNPRQRYPTAESLASDLARFLAGEPITARPVSWVEHGMRWARRRPVQATLALCFLAAVVATLAATAWHQVDLRTKLAEALAQLHAGRLVEERHRVEVALRQAEEALAHSDWAEARVQLTRARDHSASEPELAELHAHAEELLKQTEQRQRDRDRYERFLRCRNEALFHAALFGADDLQSSLRAARTAAREALACFDVTPENDGLPNSDTPYLNDREKAEVRSGCYELLLTLAATVEQQTPVAEPLRMLDRAAQLGPSTRALHLRRADLLARAGDADQARQERQRAAALGSANALGHFLDGDEHYRHGGWDAAARSFEAALRLQPDHFWARYYLALCWLKTRRHDRAEQALTACLGWRPDFPWLYLLRGSTLSELGRYADAEVDFTRAQEQPLDEAARYALLVNRGVLRVRQERYREAERDLEAAVALRPHLYQGHVNLAEVHGRQKKLTPALRHLDRAVECEPNLAALYRTRAHLHCRRQDLPAALRDLERSAELEAAAHPRAADHLERARILHELGKEDEALLACNASLTDRPGDGSTQRLRAEILLTLNRLSEAQAALDGCVQDGPADPDVLRVRAAVHARRGQYPAALADYTRVLEVDPDSAGHAARGWVYVVTDAPKLALTDFEEAIRRDPNSADARAGRGFARARLGQYRSAVADAEGALRLGPTSARLQYNAARIFAQAAQGATDAGLAQRREYQDRAVALVRRAIEATPEAERKRFWCETVLQDAALLPVRGTAGFAELAAKPPGSADSTRGHRPQEGTGR